MSKKKKSQQEIDDLVTHLRMRLEIMLNKWRVLCSADPSLNSKATFTREEFNDQVPLMLNVLFQRLANEKEIAEPIIVANEHGLHRWKSGYSLAELLIELEHLFNLVMDEINMYDQDYTKLSQATLSAIHAEVFKIYAEANKGSVGYYNDLRQTAAAEQLAGFKGALERLEELGKRRTEHLRDSSHDLRSSFSLMMMASQLLEMPGTEKERDALFRMLNTNLTSIRDMLLQLTDYTRIEAGQDVLEIKKFDVAKLIRDLVKNTLPLAEHRGFFLETEGIEHLEISSDPVKIQRILQNLLHNALSNTQNGGIYIAWAKETESRWILSIQDTGPGFSDKSPTALLAEQLKPTVQSSAKNRDEIIFQEPPSPKPSKEVDRHYKENESLGLFIVKKICDLMKASMDIESKQGQGTLVRIRFQTRQEVNRTV